MRRIIIILQVFVIWLTSCQKGELYYIDFTKIDMADSSTFRVTRQNTTHLQDLANDAELLDLWGLSEVDAHPNKISNNQSSVNTPQRATSTSVVGIMHELLDFSKSISAIELSGIYESVGIDNEPIILSGKVILPAHGHIKRYILVSHYTIASNREAPSNIFSLEGILVKLGYALIIPDYIGFGVTADQIHPYLVMDLTARNVLDMYQAVVPFLEHAGYTPEHDDIYLMGYSQGGATTMAVQHLIEHHNIPIKIRRVFAGGGPYDVKYTYDQFVETNVASYPYAVPVMMQGMVVGNKLDLDMSTMMADYLYVNLDKWINSKLYTTNQVNALIGTKATDRLLTDIGRDRTSKEVSELYKAMTENSILTYSWVPKAPVFMFHSMDDDVVPFENAMRAKSKWTNANIQYSFGHYGGHQINCIRFIYMVQTLLENDEKEEDGNFTF